MTKPLTQTELLRLEWLTRLRAGKDRQIRGQYEDGKGGVCAMGLADLILSEHGLKHRSAKMRKLHAFFGITSAAEEHIMELNDRRGWSFAMIADYIEKLPMRRWCDGTR